MKPNPQSNRRSKTVADVQDVREWIKVVGVIITAIGVILGIALNIATKSEIRRVEKSMDRRFNDVKDWIGFMMTSSHSTKTTLIT